MKGVLVAYSGGVDSTLLLKAALDVPVRPLLAVIATSETYPGKEIVGGPGPRPAPRGPAPGHPDA